MADFRDYTKLPPGWDCKYDQLTGKCYYINYLTKAMQLEDPRIRYKQLQNEKCSTESIPLQPLHGSPYHVYPTSNFPAIKAFQGPSSQSVSASPLLSTRSQVQMEMSPIVRSAQSSTPQTPYNNLPRRQTIQETSFTNPTDTDIVVAKINNMFPTASENHIRLLLKKYYNREAVVISALQVFEKHPVTMPGPFATPPSQRHLYHSNSAFQMTPPSKRIIESLSRNDSPIPGRPSSVQSGLYGSPRFGDQIRNSPKPSSPKMKLRYLKSIFPKADETLLLDILANADNNVQKASETLIAMGYAKREVLAAPKVSNRPSISKNKRDQESSKDEKIIPLHPKVITVEEKLQVKARLQAQYKTIEEKIILMALESVNYSEDRASQILQIVLQEDEHKAKKQEIVAGENKIESVVVDQQQPQDTNVVKQSSLDETDKITCISANIRTTTTTTTSTTGPNISSVQLPSSSSSLTSSKLQQTSSSKKTSALIVGNNEFESPSVTSSPTIGHKISHFRDKINCLKTTPRESSENEQSPINKNEFNSIVGRIAVKGHNSELSKGPDDTLLLADYITWNGANPDISKGHKGLAVGSDPGLLSERNYTAIGHDNSLCKGPKVGLVKGSIYSQINQNIATNVKCN